MSDSGVWQTRENASLTRTYDIERAVPSCPKRGARPQAFDDLWALQWSAGCSAPRRLGFRIFLIAVAGGRLSLWSVQTRPDDGSVRSVLLRPSQAGPSGIVHGMEPCEPYCHRLHADADAVSHRWRRRARQGTGAKLELRCLLLLCIACRAAPRSLRREHCSLLRPGPCCGPFGRFGAEIDRPQVASLTGAGTVASAHTSRAPR